MENSVAFDRGNTMVKVTRFVGTEPVESERHERLTSEIVEQAARHADVAIFSSVGNDTDEALALLNRHFRRVYNLTEQLPLPIAVDYDRARLGNDRIASAVGAHDAFPGRNILVVDAGTAITLDLVDANGTFRGGNIALGIRSRLRALHDYTSRLPLVDLEGDTPLIGITTETAMRSSAIAGAAAEVADLHRRLRQAGFDDLLTVVTGGDGALLFNRLRDDIECVADYNVLAKGLNSILRYNEQI